MTMEWKTFTDLCTLYGIYMERDGRLHCISCGGTILHLDGVWSLSFGRALSTVVTHLRKVHGHE